MIEVITGGSTGLLLGMGIQLCGLSRRENIRGALTFSRRSVQRAVLGAAGLGVMLAALLTWLAVIDVDMLTILPLDGGTVIGGAVFGLILGWTGLTPATTLTGIGGGRLLESLCGVAGCVMGALLLPYASPLFEQVQGLIPASANTWFRTTLKFPFLFSGGFLGLGCIGLVLTTLALCIRPEKPATPAEAELTPAHPDLPAPPEEAAEEAAEETFTAILPGEEPLIVDTDAETLAEEEPPTPAAPPAEETPLADEAPLLRDHPELEDPISNDKETMADEIRQREAGAGMVTPSQQAALPADARVIDKTPPEEAAIPGEESLPEELEKQD